MSRYKNIGQNYSYCLLINRNVVRFIYFETTVLTVWCRIFFEKLIVTQLVKE